MKIQRLDRWLIDSIFQPIVEWTQTQPAVLARHSIFLFAVLSIFIHSVSNEIRTAGQLIVFGIGIVGCLLLALTTLTVYFHEIFGPPLFLRMLCTFFVAMDLMMLLFLLIASFLTPVPSGLWFRSHTGLAQEIALSAFYYFAACKPPTPRPPQLELALSGGAA